MSDGVFRDDHEAAVARADALDRELAEARHERDAARAEASRLRDRLARPNAPMPLPVESSVARRRARASTPGSFAGAISVMTVGLIAAGVAFSHGNRSYTYTPVQVPELSASDLRQAQQATAMDLQGCIAIGRALSIGMSTSDVLMVTDGCERSLTDAAMSAAYSADSRRELNAVATAMIEWRDQARSWGATGLGTPPGDPPIELVRATDELHEAASQVDLEALHLRLP